VITELHADLPVDDFETAYAWYQIFFSRRADSTPHAGEALWQVAGAGWLCVVADAERSGSGRVTMLVDSLEDHVGHLAMRGIAPESVETVTGGVRRATMLDPAGNTITISERPPT
jgi:uncharacterized protein YycO